MRLDDLFKNLGYVAGTVATQLRESVVQGVSIDELDLTGPAPRHLSLVGPAHVAVSAGEMFRVEVQPGPGSDDIRFTLEDERLAIAGGTRDTVIHLSLPAPSKISITGSGRMTAEALAADGEISLAGSGRLELAHVGGGLLKVSIAGSGRLAADGAAEALELSIAGSGSCDAEGLTVERASIHIAGSGDAIFACDGEVSASLLGSGNVIVRGAARCSVHSMGSGTVVCERDRAPA